MAPTNKIVITCMTTVEAILAKQRALVQQVSRGLRILTPIIKRIRQEHAPGEATRDADGVALKTVKLYVPAEVVQKLDAQQHRWRFGRNRDIVYAAMLVGLELFQLNNPEEIE